MDVSRMRQYAMKKIGLVVMVVVLFAVSFAYVRHRMAPPRQPDRAKAAAIAQKIAENNMAAAGNTLEKPPEELPSAVAQREATESMARKLARQSGAERAGTAADNFWGFYLLNTRARPDYCAGKGVDIGAFVRAFEDYHAPEVAIAKDIYRASPERPPVDKLYEMVKPDLEATVAQDQSDMAAGLHVSQKEACEFLLKNADAMLAEVNLKKMQPAVYSALHAAKR
jgi:hypothetical protein